MCFVCAVCVETLFGIQSHAPSVLVTCERCKTVSYDVNTWKRNMPINYIIVHKIGTRAARYLFSIIFDRLQFVWSHSISFLFASSLHCKCLPYIRWSWTCNGNHIPIRHRRIDAVKSDAIMRVCVCVLQLTSNENSIGSFIHTIHPEYNETCVPTFSLALQFQHRILYQFGSECLQFRCIYFSPHNIK